MRRRLIAVVAALLAVSAGSTAAAASSGNHFNPPKHFYLALGDSLAWGFQPTGDFTHGYVADFSAMLTGVRPQITTVNYACPGETTSTFLTIHCTSAGQPHDTYAGSQLSAALAFLKAHRGEVSPITVDVGGNDLATLYGCLFQPDPVSCIQGGLPGVLGTVQANLRQILSALRAAAPNTEIIVMQYYNPTAVTIPSAAPLTNAALLALNDTIASVARAHGARLADAFPAFNVASEPGLCALASFCQFLGDIHPTTLGYSVIAGLFWDASGYSRLGD